MNKSDLTVLVPDAKRFFIKAFPDSEKLINDTEVVILIDKNRAAKRIAVFESCGVQVRPDGRNEGEAVIGKTKSVVIIYSSAIRSPDRFYHVVWHELGHIYSSFVNQKLFRDAENDLTNDLDTPLRSGMSVWSEFIAEVIAYTVEDGEPEKDFWPIFKKLESLMDEAVNSGYLNVYSLAFFCAMAVKDPSVVAWSDCNKNQVPGFNHCDDTVIPLVGDLINTLGRQSLKKNFVRISRAKLEEVGKHIDILWDYCEIVGTVRYGMNRLIHQGR